MPADQSQDPLHRWFAEQDKILDDILTRLARIEILVTDIHRLISNIPSQAPKPVAPAPEAAPRSEPAKPAEAPLPSTAPAASTPVAPAAPATPAAAVPSAVVPPTPAAPPAPPAPPAKSVPPTQPEEEEEEGFVLADWLPQLAAGGLLILLLLLWSRRRAAAAKPAAGKAAATKAKAAATPAASPRPSVQEEPPRAARPEAPKPAATSAPLVDTASVDIDLGVDTDQSDQALELAEIMLSMGLGQGAAQTLTEQIRNEPKQALRHWLKLLEVYRRNGQQAEFERSAEELRQHFNVKPEDWHARPGSQHSVEDYPHIASRLTELWGKPACLVYLKNLLADNRGGARAGFPQAVAEELLLLTAILRSEGFLS